MFILTGKQQKGHGRAFTVFPHGKLHAVELPACRHGFIQSHLNCLFRNI